MGRKKNISQPPYCIYEKDTSMEQPRTLTDATSFVNNFGEKNVFERS